MRISDWSSDVCSSDLERHFRIDQRCQRIILPERVDFSDIGDVERRLLEAGHVRQNLHPVEERIDVPMDMPFRAAIVTVDTIGRAAVPNVESRRDLRSEEHTSELQSLMRISYAVFCLQKNNKPSTHIIIIVQIS